MANVPSIRQALSSIFPSQHCNAVLEVYQQIPGSLTKFLEEQEVVTVMDIDDTLFTEGTLGTEKKKTWDTFRMDLRASIQKKLNHHGVKGIKPEELSEFISTEYLKKCPYWATPGQSLSAIVQLNKTFSDQHHRYVNAYIHARITEECENNFIQTNKYKYSYYVSMDLKGVLINEKRALELGELVSRDVPKAIALIQKQSSLSWDGFLKN